ncbi:GNAT family N-acetyltransferase [Flagellimonas sp. 389]|uniref:GNAT family N-acetyltransferase n=1 Tax=Flagellimonas sp. 389 TaxID=2835862 RepID=UPI001BD6C3CE|nr:GNAT family protein [Flagellimonas sp. 389]MBS9461138.1 GNAT family N-acetyltransferase [Flagellimonas sp. 389]
MQIDFENYSISPIQEKDAWRLCDFVVSNSERLKADFPKTVQQNLTPTLAELFVAKKVKEFMRNEEFLFTIKENTNRSIIGLLYVKELQKVAGQGELAYCISYRYEGRGIMKTCVEKIIPWCFSEAKLHTLQIIVHDSNLASKRIAEKNGFVWKRTLPKEHTTGSGEVLDMELFELHNPKSIT